MILLLPLKVSFFVKMFAISRKRKKNRMWNILLMENTLQLKSSLMFTEKEYLSRTFLYWLYFYFLWKCDWDETLRIRESCKCFQFYIQHSQPSSQFWNFVLSSSWADLNWYKELWNCEIDYLLFEIYH